MSLVDPTNPARWADGSPRCLTNAFTLGYASDKPHGYLAMEIAKFGNARANSTKLRNRRIKNGTDNATLHGMSKKADARISAHAAAPRRSAR